MFSLINSQTFLFIFLSGKGLISVQSLRRLLLWKSRCAPLQTLMFAALDFFFLRQPIFRLPHLHALACCNPSDRLEDNYCTGGRGEMNPQRLGRHVSLLPRETRLLESGGQRLCLAVSALLTLHAGNN